MYEITDAELETLSMTIKDILGSAKASKVLVRKHDMRSFFNIHSNLAEKMMVEQINDLLSVASICVEFGEWLFVDYEDDNAVFIQMNKPQQQQKRCGWAEMVLSGEAEVFDFKQLKRAAPARD